MLKFGGVVIEVGVKYGLFALVWFGKLRGYGRKGTWNWNVYIISACHQRRRIAAGGAPHPRKASHHRQPRA